MTVKQREELIGIIEKDCELAYRYFSKDGKTCAIGAMGLAANIPKELFTEHLLITSSVDACNRLWLRFGLVPGELLEIQNRNDCAPNPEERRKSIIAYLNELPVTD